MRAENEPECIFNRTLSWIFLFFSLIGASETELLTLVMYRRQMHWLKGFVCGAGFGRILSN